MHDGEPFTAHDVDFTFSRIIYNHDIPASSRPSFHFRHRDEERRRLGRDTHDGHSPGRLHRPVRAAGAFRPLPPVHGDLMYPKHILEQYVDDGTFSAVWDIETDPGGGHRDGHSPLTHMIPANVWLCSAIPITGSGMTRATPCPTWMRSSMLSSPTSRKS